MRLDPEARAVLDDALERAHADLGDGVRPRAIAASVVAHLRDSERFGLPWVESCVDDLAVVGAMKLCADWRRRHRTPAATAKGTAVAAPRFSTARDETGEFVQVAFDGMDLAAVRRRRDQLEAQRNTLSVEVRLLADLAELMERDAIPTAGQALATLSGQVAS